jgi:bifunctional non-homologous end joining protein LigD
VADRLATYQENAERLGLVRPMLATLGTLPPPETDGEFGYETKWDGVRIVAYLEAGHVRLVTRNDIDVTAAYPEVAGLGAALGGQMAIVDGEVVAYDAQGQVSFEALQSRMHVRDQAQVARLAVRTPVAYCVFDLLHLDRHPTVGLAYRQRRDLLDSLELHGTHWTTPPYRVGGGRQVLADARHAGLEGVVAKRLDSVYEPGRRSRAWIKVKNTRTQEVVIGGWKEGKGRRGGTIGALLLGIPEGGTLRYVGQVGTGFTDEALADMRRRVGDAAQETSPFRARDPDMRGAHWVSPTLVGEVEFTEWTRDGRLRHPSWRGLRWDKRADEVEREAGR